MKTNSMEMLWLKKWTETLISSEIEKPPKIDYNTTTIITKIRETFIKKPKGHLSIYIITYLNIQRFEQSPNVQFNGMSPHSLCNWMESLPTIWFISSCGSNCVHIPWQVSPGQNYQCPKALCVFIEIVH